MIPDFRDFQHSNELYHYGIPRRSGRYPWGSGERPYQSGEKNAPEIKNYKGKAYFVSTEDLDGKTLEPRVPNNFFTKNGYEDNTTKRISFAPSVDKCLLGLSQNLTGKTFYVYEPEKIDKIYKPNEKAVPDSSITDELWIKDPVKIKKAFTIKVTKDSGKDGLKFKYGKDREAELYEWDYEILDSKELEHSSESEVNFKMDNIYYLSHGGPGSGRYPLGSGDRPYQKFEGAGRRPPRGIVGYIKAKKAKKTEEQLEQQKIEEMERKRQHEADKARVLRAGTASEVMKYQGELTNKQLQDAYNRIDWERKLSSFSADEIKTGMQMVDKAMQNLKTVNNWASILTDSYNTLASVYNATKEGKKDPWPEIKKPGGGGGGKKKGGN